MVLHKLGLFLHRNSEGKLFGQILKIGCKILKIKRYAYRFNHQPYECFHLIGQFIRKRERNGQ